VTLRIIIDIWALLRIVVVLLGLNLIMLALSQIMKAVAIVKPYQKRIIVYGT